MNRHFHCIPDEILIGKADDLTEVYKRCTKRLMKGSTDTNNVMQLTYILIIRFRH